MRRGVLAHRFFMQSTVLTTVAVTGFTVAFVHAAIPTHWLPFVLVGRAHAWSGRRVMGVAALAGAGHVLFTLLLGLVLLSAGIAVQPRMGVLFSRAVGVMIMAVGLFYLLRHAFRPAQPHADPAARLSGRSDSAAIVGLVAMLTFSPCEAFLPFYVVNVEFGWIGFALLSLVLAVGTFVAMLGLTGLCLAGADRLRLERLGRYEAALIGVALCGLGLFVALES